MEKQTDLEVKQEAGSELVTIPEPTALMLMQIAIEKLSGDTGIQTVQVMEKLLDLQERVEKRNAEKEFAVAFAKFQSLCPSIPKTASTKDTRSSGTTFGFTYAPLEGIAGVVDPILAELGFSYSWDWVEAKENHIGQVCVLTHMAGHSRSATTIVPIDTGQSCNKTQKVGSASTYAKRYSLIQVLGLTTCEEDTDGAVIEPITEEQAANIESLLTEVKGNRAGFLKYMGVEKIGEILAQDLQKALTVLEQKRRQG